MEFCIAASALYKIFIGFFFFFFFFFCCCCFADFTRDLFQTTVFLLFINACPRGAWDH